VVRKPVPDPAAAFARTGATIYFDLSPLHEAHWTGIPVVAAGLAGALLAALPEQTRFFLGYDLVETDAVADALRRNTGLFLDRAIQQGHAVAGRLPLTRGAGKRVGFFPSVKPLRRAFDIELSVFHDLSTLTLPQMHLPGNVVYHADSMLADLASNDLTVTVSEATRADLIAYLGVDPARVLAAPNGVRWPDWYAAEAANLGGPAGSEPYVLILGTREPRKNILKIFEMLERFPALLEGRRFVFAGKMGWLADLHALPASLEAEVARGRILFTGFVDEVTKYALLRHAEATLYPSIFEGFGLPVLESLSVGTPCVASWSSAIPEAGGAVCEYFDPLDAVDLHRAIMALAARRPPAEACRQHAAGFTWEAALGLILGSLMKEESVLF